MIDSDDISDAWEVARDSGMWVVCQESKIYVSPPWEENTDEAVIKLFMSKEACEAWKGRMEMAAGPFVVGHIDIPTIFRLMPMVTAEVENVYKSRLKFDLCGVDDTGWPVKIDCLWNDSATRH